MRAVEECVKLVDELDDHMNSFYTRVAPGSCKARDPEAQRDSGMLHSWNPLERRGLRPRQTQVRPGPCGERKRLRLSRDSDPQIRCRCPNTVAYTGSGSKGRSNRATRRPTNLYESNSGHCLYGTHGVRDPFEESAQYSNRGLPGSERSS